MIFAHFAKESMATAKKYLGKGTLVSWVSEQDFSVEQSTKVTFQPTKAMNCDSWMGTLLWQP